MLLGLTDAVIRRPWLTVAATLLSVVVFGLGLTKITSDPDVTRDLPDDLPAKVLYDKIDEMFPSKELIIVGIESDQIFTVDGVARLDRLTRRLEAVDGVQSVMSPTSARIISSQGDMMEVRAAADPLPQNEEEVAAFRARLFDQPLYVGTLVNKAGTAVLTMVMIKAGVEESDVAGEIIALAQDPERSEGFSLLVTGRAAAEHWSETTMGPEMGMLTSLALLIVLVLLVATFRSARGVLLPLGVVVFAVVWTMGLMGFVGEPLTHSTQILPILLVAIGVADGIHILKGYYERAREGESAAAVVRATMQDLNRPVVLTSVTTVAGFLALGSSGLDSLAWLGLFTSFGVLAAMVFSLAFIPAVLCLLKLPGARAKRAGAGQRFEVTERIASAYAAFLLQRRGAIAVAVVLTIAAAAAGATRVTSEWSNLSNYRPGHPYLQAITAINRHFAGVTNLLVVVDGGAPDTIKDPAILQRMDRLEQWLRQQQHVGPVQSIVGYIKQMHRVMNGNAMAQYRIPDPKERVTGLDLVEEDGQEVEREVTLEVPGRELVAQYLALYEMSGKPEDLANVVTYRFDAARMTVLLDSDRASVLTDLHDRLQKYLAEHFAGARVVLTGMAELVRAFNAQVVRGQAWSLLSSMLLVLVLTSILFRSPVLGFFSTLPLFFCIFFNFGFMGITGIPLNVMTIATSSIAIGVGVDYAIHLVHRYQHDRRAGLDYLQAVDASLRSSGVAIFFNATTVALGFFALFFAQFRSVSEFGMLIAMTMFTSAFAALTILPVFFALVRPKVFAGPAQAS